MTALEEHKRGNITFTTSLKRGTTNWRMVGTAQCSCGHEYRGVYEHHKMRRQGSDTGMAQLSITLEIKRQSADHWMQMANGLNIDPVGMIQKNLSDAMKKQIKGQLFYGKNNNSVPMVQETATVLQPGERKWVWGQ